LAGAFCCFLSLFLAQLCVEASAKKEKGKRKKEMKR
jgi:hypothetical protein